jgi:UDPglucose--hexose-1-phosphate uridylyltransferase
MPLRRTDLTQPDGRQVYLYGDFAPAPDGYEAPRIGQGAYERRWNPLRQEWVLYAAARQDRTFLPEQALCPLCPSRLAHSTEIPATRFGIAVFENRFPAMLSGAPTGGGNHALASGGVCEVVVYSDEHQGAFASLDAGRLEALAEVWTDRYRQLASRQDVSYVFIFENRGPQVGVTLLHPHGQIYGYPFIPPAAKAELAGRGPCAICSALVAELRGGERLLANADGLVTYIPQSARWAYEVHVAVRPHRETLPDLERGLRRRFVTALQRVARAYDRLFDEPMPYMLAIHQRPSDGRPYPRAHLHAEFYPLLRDRGKLKYLAGSESGAGVFINDTLPEQSAARLRTVFE